MVSLPCAWRRALSALLCGLGGLRHSGQNQPAPMIGGENLGLCQHHVDLVPAHLGQLELGLVFPECLGEDAAKDVHNPLYSHSF